MLYTLLIILHVLTSVCLIAIILMQSAKGEGLAGAFGMGGGAQSLFGADTATVLTKGTVVLAIIFAVTTLSLMLVHVHKGKSLVDTTPAAVAESADDLSDTAALVGDVADTDTE